MLKILKCFFVRKNTLDCDCQDVGDVTCFECMYYVRCEKGLIYANDSDYKKMCQIPKRAHIVDYDVILGKNTVLKYFDPRIKNRNFNCKDFKKKEGPNE